MTFNLIKLNNKLTSSSSWLSSFALDFQFSQPDRVWRRAISPVIINVIQQSSGRRRRRRRCCWLNLLVCSERAPKLAPFMDAGRQQGQRVHIKYQYEIQFIDSRPSGLHRHRAAAAVGLICSAGGAQNAIWTPNLCPLNWPAPAT